MKVGDYVRTENGIDKVSGYRYEPEYENGHVIWFEKSDNGCRYTDNDLLKSSPNIIDLIEVGDYVNGERIQFITNKKELLTDGGYDLLKKYEDIKSIVTKEQFEEMKYEIKRYYSKIARIK